MKLFLQHVGSFSDFDAVYKRPDLLTYIGHVTCSRCVLRMGSGSAVTRSRKHTYRPDLVVVRETFTIDGRVHRVTRSDILRLRHE